MNNPIQMVFPSEGNYTLDKCVVDSAGRCEDCGFCERWTQDGRGNVYHFEKTILTKH